MIKTCLAVVAIACAAGTSAAEDAQKSQIDEVLTRLASPQTKRLAVGAVRRVRRAIAIGPTAGAWGAYEPSPSSSEGAVTLGVGIELFDVTAVPGLDDLQEIIVERTKAKLEERLRHGGANPPDRAELEQAATQIYEDTKAEVIAQMSSPPAMFERPKLTLALEFDRLLRADVWQARLRAGVGISRITVGATAAYGFGDSTVRVGPELTAHALLSSGARTPVLDVLARYDFELAHRDRNTDMVVLGVRLLLDLI